MIQLPEEFQQQIKKNLGNAYAEFMASLSENPPASIRLNPNKKIEKTEGQPVPWSTFGRYLAARPVFTLDPLIHAGAYYVQEASSMFLEQAFSQHVNMQASIRVLDLCAAPGGKSTHIASMLNDQSLLVSNEVIRSRASILSENIQKWGYANTIVTRNDPGDFEALAGFFDVVVLDAPCSGEGLFRKDPRTAEEWSPQHVALCASRQKRILSDIWPALKENGILIYCTCTYNEAENEDNLRWLKQQRDVEFLKLEIADAWDIEEVSVNEIKGYRFFPHRTKGEGFFLSAMRKKEPAYSGRMKPKRSLTPPPKKIIGNLQSWISSPSAFAFFQHADAIYFLPSFLMEEAGFMAQHLKIVHAGTRAAAAKHEKLIPEHGLAMSIKINRGNFNAIAVTLEEAIRFLRRDALSFSGKSKGYHLITYENIPLGWINHLGNRINNLYPQDWRIRMAAP